MRYDELEELLGRLKRLAKRLEEQSGDRFEWECTFDNGETHRYVIEGLREPELIGDDLANAFVWLWSLKDYLKEYERAGGRDSSWVEALIDADAALPVCGDIANSAKPGRLRTSRSQTFARLGKPHYRIPQAAMGTLTFKAFEVDLNVARPELVEVTVPVQDNRGGMLGDALEYLHAGLTRFERAMVERAIG